MVTIMTENEQKTIGEQYLDYILDHQWYHSQEEKDAYALLLFMDDLEEWKHEGE